MYRIREDDKLLDQNLLKVLDDSGEEYLYPADYFEPVLTTRRAYREIGGRRS